MFNIGSQEVLVILLLVFLLFGPKHIPEVAHTLGKGLGELRRVLQGVEDDVRRSTRPIAPPDAGAARERSILPPGKDRPPSSPGSAPGVPAVGPAPPADDPAAKAPPAEDPAAKDSAPPEGGQDTPAGPPPPPAPGGGEAG